MKRSFLRSLPAVAVMFLALPALAQNKGMAVNNDGRAPNPKAILDVSSNYLPVATAIQKGMLIPRVTLAQRNTNIGAGPGLPQGLTVYQTDNTPGFYVVEYGTWFRIDGGSNGWNVTGNVLTSPVNDFFGTRDDQDLVFKTNNVQVMRLEGTPATRYVHIGVQTTVPNEQLDVQDGNIRIYNPSPGSWAATNPATRFAATNTQGTILFRPSGAGTPGDSLRASWPSLPAPQNQNTLMWNGHWGNIDGTAPGNLTLGDAHAGGWNRLENEYEERFTKTYTQQGTPTCGPGQAELSFGSTLYSNGLAAAAGVLMNPFKYDVAARRWRSQYLFLKQELNVESNQLGLPNPPANPAATGGLCAGSAINQIGFWVNQAITAASAQRNLQITVTVKHAPLGTNSLASFDNSVDPGAGCYTSGAILYPPITAGANWQTFAISPFTWDGVRNVIVEVAVTAAAGGAGNIPGGLPVRYSTTSANLTYSAYAAAPYPLGFPCTPTAPTNSVCGPAQNATALGDCGTFGASVNRPVVRFSGQVDTAPVATTGLTNSFLWYNGGLIVENTTSPNPWGRQTVPYFAFRGPGTISAESGVYDNGTKLNDHVFDRAFDGAVKPADAETFGTVRNLDIQEMADQTRLNRHLPTMKGRDSWRVEKGFSLGDLTNQLWTTAETQALYLSDLNDRLNVIELLSNDRPLDAAESQLAKNSIRSLKGYTEAEKAALTNTIDRRTVTTNQR